MTTTRNGQHSIGHYAQQLGMNPDSGIPYRLEGYGYLDAPLNSLSPRVVIQKGAQVGALSLPHKS